MRKIATLLMLVMIVSVTHSQVLKVENFDYAVGDTLTSHGWVAHSGAGSNSILVAEGNLTYPGYSESGIGNMTIVTGMLGTREDINLTYEPVTSGSVYHSFLINVQSASIAQDYFANVGPSPIGTSFRGRIMLKDDSTGTKFYLGLSQSSSSPAFTTEKFDYNTTILLVLEYKFLLPALNDDSVKLYINPVLGGAEPAPALTYVYDPSVNADLANCGAFALRQGSKDYSLKVDGLKIYTSWSDIVPVELTSFNAVSNGNNVNVNWVTATETNNSGFELYRNGSKVTFIKGNGTTAERSSYSYTDKELTNGNYSYQLYQIDFDGTRSLVGKTSVEVNAVPVEFALNQNYPNPFNPSTSISFSIPNASSVKLTIYNAIGKEVATLVNGTMESGNHKVVWNASNMPSGMYFYKLQADNFTSTKKMMLIK